MEHVIELEDITAAYDRQPVLWDLDLNIPKGSLMGIVGPNGAGKSTLLKIILNLLAPVSGRIRFSIDGETDAKKARRKIAYVPQNGSVNWDFPATVKDIVLMGRYPYKQHFGTYSADDVKIAEHYMNEVGITHLADEQIHHLSGGEKQRVFIAKALTQKPQILLLDEPTNHLDMKYKVALMKQLRAFKGTTIVVLHDLNLAAQYCDHIVIMNKGTILKEGSPTEVLTPEILEPIFEVPFKTSWDEGRYHLYY